MSKIKNMYSGLEIAVIGMSGRFPGANNIEEYWNNIRSGVESISFLDDEQLLNNNIAQELIDDPNFVKSGGGIVDNKDCFDSDLFGITEREAKLMHPQARILHECVWNSLEDAGYIPDLIDSKVGLYVGGGSSSLWELYNQLAYKSNVLGGFESSLLTERDYLHSRVSYNLNFNGPSFLIQTTCSTSIVAIHTACRSLLTGECNIAVAGAVRVNFLEQNGYLYEEGMVNSPDGHCRAFDKDAKGIIGGEGIGIVVLKRLKDAIADKDNIHCIIKGSAINNDGNRKVGYTAPSIEGQKDVIMTAQKFSEVSPESISYIEAHGTGTNLGDLVEIEALKQAFNSENKAFCAIGSVKPNIGHLGEAAGIAGFIKTICAIKNRQLPPSINCKEPNPKIEFENTPFYVNTELKDWSSNGYPLRAGLSSFGIGGTNAHIILEEAQIKNIDEVTTSSELIILSANSKKALERNTKNTVKFLKNNSGINLFNVAYTLQVGRKNFPYKKMVLCSSIDELVKELGDEDSKKAFTNFHSDKRRKLIFMFPGQGNQYVNMGRELYFKEDTFKSEIDKCFHVLEIQGENEIKSLMFPNHPEVEEEKIAQIDIAPIVNFIFEYSYSMFLINKGIRPYSFIGHSIGEYVAACLSGVFSLEDAIKMVTFRGKLMKKLPLGLMLSVPVEKKKISQYINNKISLAADHGDSCILSGSVKDIEDLETQLKNERLICQRLPISHAGHSKSMNSILDIFKDKLKEITFNVPQIPYVSSLTGKWMIPSDAIDLNYWVSHIKETVLFADGIKEFIKKDDYIYMEVGPGNSLSTIVTQYLSNKKKRCVINLVKFPLQKETDSEYLYSKLGKAWLQGYEVNWNEFYLNEKFLKVSLPGYSFDKKVFKINDQIKDNLFSWSPDKFELIDNPEQDISNWFYIPSWKTSILQYNDKKWQVTNKEIVLIFTDNCGLGREIRTSLIKEKIQCVLVEASNVFKKHDVGYYTINPEDEESYKELFDQFRKDSNIPTKILHLWGFSRHDDNSLLNSFDQSQYYGYYSLLNIAKEIGNHNISENIELHVVTSNMQSVQSEDLLCPEKATSVGPVRVIPLEYKNISCVSIDVNFSEINWKIKRLSEQLLSELKTGIKDQFVCFRSNRRYVQFFESTKITKNIQPQLNLKEKGAYLITGGLGYVGLNISEYLAKTVQPKLFLTTRSDFPSKNEWIEYLLAHEEFDPKSCRIRKLIEIEKYGGEVFIHKVDVVDFDGMKELYSSIVSEYNRIDGVLHCAMHPEGAIIHQMNNEISDRVFAPKIKGSIILAELFKNAKPDFLILCSSQHSFMGREVSYNSANNFVDAFSYYCSSNMGLPTTSINWCNWADIKTEFDYKVQLIKSLNLSELKKVTHPLVSKSIELSPDIELFICDLDPTKDWVLNEHRIMRKATLVGTAYLEMVYKAFTNIYHVDKVKFRNVQLNATMDVDDSDKVEVYVILKKWKTKADFTIISKIKGNEDTWKENVTGSVCKLDEEEPNFDLTRIQSSIEKLELDQSGLIYNTDETVLFGERWMSIKNEVFLNEREGLLKLKLPIKYSNDFREYLLHPSLFDRTCGLFASKMTPEDSLYLPVHYDEIKVYGPITGEIYGYVKELPQQTSNNKVIKFSIDIIDSNGKGIISISDYSLIDVRLSENNNLIRKEGKAVNEALFDDALHGDGIKGEDGIEIFSRILNLNLSQVLLSQSDFNHVVFEPEIDGNQNIIEGEEIQKELTKTNLSVNITSRVEIEYLITNILKDILGCDNINSNDNFFEIGANSLTIVNLNNKLKKALQKDISIVDLYTYPSVYELTKFLSESKNEKITVLRHKRTNEKLNERRKRIRKK